MLPRRTPPLTFLLLLAATAIGCADAPLPTAAAPGPASLNVSGAATCVVTSTADAGDGSLRARIADESCSTITFALAGTGPHTITLTSGQLTISRNLTIIGPGPDLLLVVRSPDVGAFRIVLIDLGVEASISGLTIQNGASLNGGGIRNRGTLTLTHSTVIGNGANNGDTNGSGGGIWNDGSMVLSHSTVEGNNANVGGGIGNIGSLTINNSTIWNNAATSGAGIVSGGALTVTHSSVVGNWSSANGGILGLATLRNSIIAANTPVNCSNGVKTDAGYNLDDGTTCGFTAVSSLQSTNPQLDPYGLKNNGGATGTIALMAGSPAIDTGVCTDFLGSIIATDQRGISRPQGAGCDMGAFELEVAAPTFDFSGFLAPVVTAPGVNVVKPGRVIPIKFSLAGDQGLEILDGVPTSKQIACSLAEVTSAVEETATAGNSTLTYDAVADQYSYIWKTEKGWARSCREFSLTLSDGTTHTAQFQFTR